MPLRYHYQLLLILSCFLFGRALGAAPNTEPSRVEVTQDGRLLLNGSPFLLIQTSPGPPHDLRTPEGQDGWTELADGGINNVRSIVHLERRETSATAAFEAQLDKAAEHGMSVWPNLHAVSAPRNDEQRERLKTTIRKYHDHPGVLMWKSQDEPEWGKVPVDRLREGYRIIKELDPNHPVVVVHAPRGTTETLQPYSEAGDIIGTDIYPISVPKGKHSLLPNKEISMVGDYTRRTVSLCKPGQMPYMVLQVCWSGVMPTRNPKNKLMFPTFREARYMTYQAFINGANGVAYFGFPFGLTGRDYELGWNWTYWRGVMKPLISEFKAGTEMNLVLTTADTSYPLSFTGAPQIEARWKEVGPYLYIMAAAREGEPQSVIFEGVDDGEVTVLFENRTVQAIDGIFEDDFHQYDVHIYRALRKMSEVPRTAEQQMRWASRTKVALPGDEGEATAPR